METTPKPSWTISNLATVPHFVDTVAHRSWQAWWQDDDVPLEAYRAGLEPFLNGQAIPLGFVAHAGDQYLGSALLIENDLESRPKLKPWLAALWVDEAERGKGLASQLMLHVRSKAANLGIKTLYVCAVSKLTPFYKERDWQLIETDVDGQNIFEISTN